MLKDIAVSSYRHGWFSMDELKSIFYLLAMDAYGGTDECKTPG
jgi:hypothetical protein